MYQAFEFNWTTEKWKRVGKQHADYETARSFLRKKMRKNGISGAYSNPTFLSDFKIQKVS